MSIISVSEKAKEAAGYFITAQRADGTSYVKTTDDSPAWLTDLIREAHGDMLPDDHTYKLIHEACEFMAEGGDDEGEFADQSVDVYNGDRIAWLASHAMRAHYCDEAISEGIADLSGGIIDLIGAGQYMEALEAFQSVRDSLSAL